MRRFPKGDTHKTASRFTLSRRDALRLLGTAALAPFLGRLWRWQETSASSPKWGRVAWERVDVYAYPSFQAPRMAIHWMDTVLPIAQTVVAREPAHNPIWYRLARGGYVHSGGVQPVEIRPQAPQPVPEGGALAEVTVPYTDAFIAPTKNSMHMYRLYYSTTHWVLEAVPGDDDPKETWYLIQEDKWDLRYYAPARHLRLIPPEELAPLSPHVPGVAKRILVDLDAQVLMALEYDQVVFATRVATGAVFSDGDFRTPTGVFLTAHKRPSRHMAANNLARNGYDLPGVPWVCYITESGIALHGTYWHNDFGRPRSHGCINLSPAAARWVFRWTLPVVPPERQWVYDEDVATLVEIVGSRKDDAAPV